MKDTEIHDGRSGMLLILLENQVTTLETLLELKMSLES